MSSADYTHFESAHEKLNKTFLMKKRKGTSRKDGRQMDEDDEEDGLHQATSAAETGVEDTRVCHYVCTHGLIK